MTSDSSPRGLVTLRKSLHSRCTGYMAPWFLTAVERRDGSWVAHWAGLELDPVPTEADAIDLLACLATALGGPALFDLRLHRRDGRVRRMTASDARPRYRTTISRRLLAPSA